MPHLDDFEFYNGTDEDFFNSTKIFDPWATLGYAGPIVIFFTLVVIFFNILAIKSIVWSKDLFKQTAFALLASQAMTDLAVGFTSFMYYLVFVPLEGTFSGPIGCNFFAFMICFSCYATLGSLSLIAHSRRVLILRNQRVDRKHFQKLLVFWVWFNPLFVTLTFYFMTGFHSMHYNTYCCPLFAPKVVIFQLCTSTPHMGYMAITYLTVWREVRRTQAKVGGTKTSDKKKAKENKSQRKMTLVMIAMCGMIMMGYTPLVLYMIISAFGIIPPRFLERGCAIFIMMNSALTPLIYPFTIKKVRTAMVNQLGIRQCMLNLGVKLNSSTRRSSFSMSSRGSAATSSNATSSNVNGARVSNAFVGRAATATAPKKLSVLGKTKHLIFAGSSVKPANALPPLQGAQK